MITAEHLRNLIDAKHVGATNAARNVLRDAAECAGDENLAKMALTVSDYAQFLEYDPDEETLFGDEPTPEFSADRYPELAEAINRAAELLNKKQPELETLKTEALVNPTQENIKALFSWLMNYGGANDTWRVYDYGLPTAHLGIDNIRVGTEFAPAVDDWHFPTKKFWITKEER